MIGHVLIVGQTMSGKTELAKRLAAQYVREGVGVIVHDKFWSDWGQDDNPDQVYVTDNDSEFVGWVRRARSCAIFVDEAPDVCGRTKEASKFLFLGTQARHWGHRSHFIAQGLTQIHPVIRAQCPTLYVFRLTMAESEKLYAETGDPIFRECSGLQKGEFILQKPFVTSRRLRLW